MNSTIILMIGVIIVGKNIKILTVDDLQEGMVTASKVEQNGALLLNNDVKITKSIINRLKRMYFFGSVEVYDDDNQIQESTESQSISNEDNLKNISKNNIQSSISQNFIKQDKNIIKTKEDDLEKIYDSKYRKVETEFNNMSKELVNIFDRIVQAKGKIGLDDIRRIEEFEGRIQNELKSTSTIIKNIVLKGSGIDCIYRHSVNVAALSALLGTWIGMEDYKLKSLIDTAILHDCGKVMVDNNVLNKETKLSNDEFISIKKHTNYGYNLVKNIAGLDKHISYGVLMHHERLDGTGYPLGVKSNGIHPFAKIVAIADIFDAINSNRGYKMKKPPFEAMQIVKDESDKKIDSEYARVFLEHISNYYMGEEALLNNSEKCKIMQVNIDDLKNPIVFKNGKFLDLSKVNNLYVKEIIV